jgi:hypothetical protein
MLAGYSAALERRLTGESGETQQSIDRKDVQARGLKLAFETANLWDDDCGNLSQLIERVFRIGVETGVDSIMVETLAEPKKVAGNSTVPADHHTYTLDEASPTGLCRLDA